MQPDPTPFVVRLAGKGGVAGKGFCHCPIPSCTTAKGKVKGRLRRLPKKFSTMARDSKEVIAAEMRKSISVTLFTTTADNPIDLLSRIR